MPVKPSITLKTWPAQFNAVANHTKTFEWRKEDDKRFEEGDLIELREFFPCETCDATGEPQPGVPCGHCGGTKGQETGRWIMVKVTYVLRGRFGVPEGYAVLSIYYVTQGRD